MCNKGYKVLDEMRMYCYCSIDLQNLEKYLFKLATILVLEIFMSSCNPILSTSPTLLPALRSPCEEKFRLRAPRLLYLFLLGSDPGGLGENY